MINKCAKSTLRIICIFIISIIITSFFPGNLMTVSAKKTTNRIIVAMGDSYSSGEGIETFFGWDKESIEKTVTKDDWLAHRSEKAWSGMLTLPSSDGTPKKMEKYDTKTKKGNWYFVASSGATTGDINYSQAKEYSKGGLRSDKDNPPALEPQIKVFDELKNNGKEADYVTLTLGGNDAGFADVVTKAAISNPYLHINLFYASITSSIKKIPNIKNDLYNVYHDIKDAAKHADGTLAEIIVAGYPELLGNLWTPISSSTFFTHDEVFIMNSAVRYFNSEIEAVVKDCQKENMKIHFVSVEDSFKGHGAYANPLQLTSIDDNIDENNEKNLTEGEYINRVVILAKEQDLKDSPPSAYSMHPNLRGAHTYAKCVQAKIDEIEKEKGNNDEPLVVELDDDQGSNFKSGKYLVNIENKIICAKSDGVYFKENIESSGTKIANEKNVYSLVSDGNTVFYAEGYDSANFDQRNKPKKVYKTSLSENTSEYLFESDGYVELIGYQDNFIYYLDQNQSNQYAIMKFNTSDNSKSKLTTDWDGQIISPCILGNKLYAYLKSNDSNNGVFRAYDLSTDNHEDIYNGMVAYNIFHNDEHIVFDTFTVSTNNGRYAKDNHITYTVEKDGTVKKSPQIMEDCGFEYATSDGKYGLYFSTIESGEFDLFTIDLETGKVFTSENDAGSCIGKNYFITNDLLHPENIYFMYNLKLYDVNTKSAKKLSHDEFEINITKPMWIIDGYIVDWDMNIYKIYDSNTEETKTSTKISSDEATKIALEKAGGDDQYSAFYEKTVQYEGQDYYLINIRRKVDDGNGQFHFSHIGYSIVSMDGKDVKSAEYDNANDKLYVF